jgi:uncharacterized protein (TIGR02001 family)
LQPARRCSGDRPSAHEACAGQFPEKLAIHYKILLTATSAAWLSFAAAPASAQVSGSISADSDFRLRGYSMSAGRPVASARIGFDHGSGLYADGSATVVFPRHEGSRFLGYQVDAGIAKRLGREWTIDAGVAHNEFRAAYSGGYPYTYTEGYVGATHGPISAYVFVSPNYFRPSFWTVYGQLEASVSPADKWHVTAHVGRLTYVDTPGHYSVQNKRQYDWRLGVAREIGNFEVHAALTGGGPRRQYYYGANHSRTALVAGASLSF